MSSDLAGPSTETPDETPARPMMGLRQATALIVGSIIGVGIFNLPGSLSAYGPITLLSMVLVTVGAFALALLFAALSRRLPADGGPYAYARVAFGNGIGFANAWSYWITAWAGNAAIVIGWVLLRGVPLNKGGTNSPLSKGVLIIVALIGLWIPALINLTGVAEHGLGPGRHHRPEVRRRSRPCRSIGLFFINTAQLPPVERQREAPTSRPSAARLALGLFSYLGVETAAVAAGKVRDPDRNVPKATHLRHPCLRSGLPALAVRGVRYRARRPSCRSPTPRSPPR